MIQRVQSLFLLGAAILNLLFLPFPLWKVTSPDGNDTAVLYGISIQRTGNEVSSVNLDDPFLLAQLITTVMTSAWIVYTIFGYNDRIRQIRTAYMGIGILLLQILISIFLTQRLKQLVPGVEDYAGTVQFGFFFPVFALLLVWGAIFYIRKDEELVRSSERFR